MISILYILEINMVSNNNKHDKIENGHYITFYIILHLFFKYLKKNHKLYFNLL